MVKKRKTKKKQSIKAPEGITFGKWFHGKLQSGELRDFHMMEIKLFFDKHGLKEIEKEETFEKFFKLY